MKNQAWYLHIFPKGRPLRWILPALLLGAAVLVQWRQPTWAERVEFWTIDARFRVRGVEQPRNKIIIVALDEDSFQMIGVDPLTGKAYAGENIRSWPRANWAKLVDKIAEGKPRVIVLDVTFDTPGWDSGGDEALARSMAAAGNVVLVGQMVYSEGGEYTKDTYSTPPDVLTKAAITLGAANMIYDADGAVRREKMLWLWRGGNTQPSFALVTAGLYNRAQFDIQRSELDDDLSLPINFRGPEGTFQTVPMYTLLMDVPEKVSPDIFRDAIVLVGYTTLLEQDRHLTPFSGEQRMPGVELQANAIDTLLARDWLHRPPAWLPMLLVVAAGLLGFILTNLPSPAMGLLTMGGIVIAYLGTGLGLFARADYILPLAAPVIVAVAMSGAVTAERVIFAERDKRILRRRFAGVMSPERLQAVLDNWEALMDADRPEKEAAVLFADIRGFTHATEVLMHQNRSPEMVRFLNAYLDAMTQAVFLEGGVVYRTFGDGLLILFGVPEPLPDHSLHAVRAAVRMGLASQDLQKLWPLREEALFQMGVGLNDGWMVDAIVGRGRRFDYTVLGDPVNAAARIEGHCKVAMEIPRPPGGQVPETVTILVSDALYQKVRDQVLVDENIPPFEARGKSEALRVVRLLGFKEAI